MTDLRRRKKLFDSDPDRARRRMLNHIVRCSRRQRVDDHDRRFLLLVTGHLLLALVMFRRPEVGLAADCVVVGVGFLAKYAMSSAADRAVVLWIDGDRGRRELKRWEGGCRRCRVPAVHHPVIAWNARQTGSRSATSAARRHDRRPGWRASSGAGPDPRIPGRPGRRRRPPRSSYCRRHPLRPPTARKEEPEVGGPALASSSGSASRSSSHEPCQPARQGSA